jgi:hypothetical protein
MFGLQLQSMIINWQIPYYPQQCNILKGRLFFECTLTNVSHLQPCSLAIGGKEVMFIAQIAGQQDA